MEDVALEKGLKKRVGFLTCRDGLRCREWGEVHGRWGGGGFGSEILSSREAETHVAVGVGVEW